MNKKILISSVAMFAMFALAGCGNSAEQEAKEAQVQSELDAQQQEMDMMKESMEQEKVELESATDELVTQTCAQELATEQTQLDLLEKHAKALEDLEKQVQKSPDFAIQTCRDLNPGLSKPECETRVKDYMGGKKVEYDETQEQIVETEARIVELEAKCASVTGATVDANGNTVTAGCQSWFDGCNTCKVGEAGAPMACTMMACDAAAMQPAKCMD